jgi:peptide/nickel transport system permease protein
MLASDLGYLSQQPWAPFYPGLIIMITVGSLNLLADAIRDAGPDDVRRGWRRTLAVAAGSGLVGPMVEARDEGPPTEPSPEGTSDDESAGAHAPVPAA